MRLLLLLILLQPLVLASADVKAFDNNSDGEPDQWYNLVEGRLSLYEADRNFDGSIDHRAEFNDYEQLIYEEFDFNHDGKMDDFYFFEEGVLVKQEIDSNFDSTIDIWVYLKEGRFIDRIERDLDYDGTVDLVKEVE